MTAPDKTTAHTREWLSAHRSTAIIGALFLLVIALLLISVWRGPKVSTLTLQPREFVQSVVASARVQTQHRVDLGAQITGTAVNVFVNNGDTVKAGQVLVELDAREAKATALAANLAVTQAELKLRQLKEVQAPMALQADREAAANLTQARAQFLRQQDLFNQGFIGQAALDDAVRARDVALAQARSARAQLAADAPQGSDLQLALANLALARANAEEAQSRLAYTRITAPVDGTVFDRAVEPGQVLQAGKTLFTLTPVGIVELIAQIDEKNLGQLRLGQSALASADAYPQQRFNAQVTQISPGVDAQRGSVELRLRVDQPPEYLRQDMTVSVEIEVGRHPQSLVLPLNVLHEPDGGASWVWVWQQGRVHRADLTLGERAGGWVVVQRGLQAGQVVVSDTAPTLREGQHARRLER